MKVVEKLLKRANKNASGCQRWQKGNMTDGRHTT